VKYDRKAIADDYAHGMSLPALSKKYHISLSYAREVITAQGVKPRTVSNAVIAAKWPPRRLA
jgi:Mor family transcriptional regulator